MKDTIKKIRQLLDELESKPASEEPSFKETFQLFELPELVVSIVDYLQPALQPTGERHQGASSRRRRSRGSSQAATLE